MLASLYGLKNSSDGIVIDASSSPASDAAPAAPPLAPPAPAWEPPAPVPEAPPVPPTPPPLSNDDRHEASASAASAAHKVLPPLEHPNNQHSKPTFVMLVMASK
jgi:hypothetical protein